MFNNLKTLEGCSYLTPLLIITVLGFVGWVLNIIAIYNSSFDPLTGLVVLRVVGIFVMPLGAIIGWF